MAETHNPVPETADPAVQELLTQAAAEDRPAHADRIWRAVLEIDPARSEAALAVAAFAARSGQPLNALVYLCHALRHAEPSEEALLVAHDAMAGLTGEAEEASTAGQSADALGAALARGLDDPGTAGLWPEARDALKRLVEWSGAAVETRETRPVSIDYDKELEQAEAPSTLLERLREHLQSDPNARSFDEAIARATRHPDDPEAWYILGRDCYARDDMETAEKLFRKAASLDRDSIKYRMNFARALAACGRYDAAFVAYRGLEDMSSNSRTDGYHLEEAKANLRSLLSRLILMVRQATGEGDAERAWSLFELIQDHPEVQDQSGIRSAILRLSIDEVMTAHKAESPRTLALARAHLNRDPDSVYVRQVMGQALMTAGRYREAADVWGSLTVSLPDNARMQLQYAKCLERSGAGEAALTAANRALELDAGLESAQIIRDRLTAG
ncbi:tetratricopeptide repeat protein [Minwuia sp.]|uniref:tetratricopeptide repeat protein n=1 Tax=Minwuia sp. TaxID=2493630 RepID=UPI003A94549A